MKTFPRNPEEQRRRSAPTATELCENDTAVNGGFVRCFFLWLKARTKRSKISGEASGKRTGTGALSNLEDIREAKRRLRAWAAERRRALSAAETAEAGRRIQEKVLALPEYRAARTVMVYVSLPGEPDTRGIILDAVEHGKRVLLPRCPDAQRMEAGLFTGFDRLVPGRMGIPEPADDADPGVAPDLILVPCVAADREGRRLGHGAGYYDRFLARQNGKKICMCFQALLTERLPTEETDVRMDRVVTEQEEDCGMKQTIFTGAGTAIITPFTADGVDFDALGRLLDDQIAKGIDAIVPTGTSGEGSTLTDAEHEAVVSFCVKRVAGRVPVIAGTGSNNTAHAIERTQTAKRAGADAALLVTPYYNKTTQRGLIAHYTAIADAGGLPCVLYNVPSRTGLNMLPETLAVLADHERIVAVKEACGNISQVARERLLCGDRLDIYSGSDDQIVPILSLGGKGVISVIANILPAETAGMCRRFFAGDIAGAAREQLRLLNLMDQLMIETNPIPAKAACAALGFGENRVRLPLVPMEEKNRQRLLELMREAGLPV